MIERISVYVNTLGYLFLTEQIKGFKPGNDGDKTRIYYANTRCLSHDRVDDENSGVERGLP